jgi:hypothetical protein
MTDSMKVHLYQVISGLNTPKLETVLEASLKMPLTNRERLVGQQEMRLEQIAKPHSKGNSSDYWLMDFTRLRFTHGPGKVSRGTPIEGFDLQTNQGFGEETGVLYDPATGYLIVQYNHHGVRSGTLKEYFGLLRDGQADTFEMRPKMDETSEQRLAQKQVITKMNFKVAPANITSRLRSGDVGLGRAIELNDSFKGNEIEITIASGRGSNGGLLYNAANSLISSLKKLVEHDDDTNRSVTKFDVWARNIDYEAAEKIDMLTPKVAQTIDGLVLGTDLRYTRESRWNGLLRARNGWTNLVKT